MARLISVLVNIAGAQSAFYIKGQAQSDGSYKITVLPEMTTFSDHIVMSCQRPAKPAEIDGDVWEVVANGWDGTVREHMQNLTAQVVMAALDVGLLVRGGLSRGRLYHNGRVVVGEALVDAYCLEKKVAQNPRVVVSERISDNDRLYTDADGVRCLDYINAMMLLADRQGDAKAWAQGRLAEIESTIDGLKERKHKEKWVYFKNKLQYEMAIW